MSLLKRKQKKLTIDIEPYKSGSYLLLIIEKLNRMWKRFKLLVLFFTLLAPISFCYKNYQFTSSDVFGQMPLYSLGTLQAGDVVTFKVKFPVATTVTPQ